MQGHVFLYFWFLIHFPIWKGFGHGALRFSYFDIRRFFLVGLFVEHVQAIFSDLSLHASAYRFSQKFLRFAMENFRLALKSIYCTLSAQHR